MSSDSSDKISEPYLQKYLVFADIKQLNLEVESNTHFERLLNAFPTVEKNITRSILLASRGDLAPAFNALLSLTCEDIQLGLPMRRYEYLPDRGLMERALKGKQEDILDKMISQNHKMSESCPQSSTVGNDIINNNDSHGSNAKDKIATKGSNSNNNSAKNKNGRIGSKTANNKPANRASGLTATKKEVSKLRSDTTNLTEKLSQSVKSGKQRSETTQKPLCENLEPESAQSEGEAETKSDELAHGGPEKGEESGRVKGKEKGQSMTSQVDPEQMTTENNINPFDVLIATDENEDDHSEISEEKKT